MARDRSAAKLGVRIGMSIAQASDLLHRSPHAALIQQHDPAQDQAALERLAARMLRETSPLVAIEPLDAKPWAGQTLHQPQTIVCDVTGCVHLFGDESGLLQATEALLAELNYQARLVIADSFALGWSVAHYGSFPPSSPTRLNIPSGVVLPVLHPLPVQSLRIAPETVATLERLGVRTIEALLQLPRIGLASRLGEHLMLRIAQALGEVDEPLNHFRPPAAYSSTHELEYPTDDRTILEDRIARLLQSIREDMTTSGSGIQRLACHLALMSHPPLTLDVGLFAPTLDTNHLQRLFVTTLDNKILPSLVSRLTIDVTLASPLRSRQPSLLDDDEDDWTDQHAVARLLDTLSGRLGRDSVVGISLDRDPLPESAYQTKILTGESLGPPSQRASGKRRRFTAESQAPVTKHQRRPIVLFAKPLPIEVVDLDHPVDEDPPLKAFQYERRLLTIIRAWGPERIETGWWYGPCVRRDYFRVETDGGWWWIYRDLTSKLWFLHGQFA